MNMEVSEHLTEGTPGNQEECPQCGVVLYGGVLSGLCPKCLLQGLRGSPAEGTETLWPPSVEVLAKAMRGNGVEPIKFIGRGGMGAVFKAHQCDLNRIVALKVMPPTAAMVAPSTSVFTVLNVRRDC
jgi:hypothetical protein